MKWKKKDFFLKLRNGWFQLVFEQTKFQRLNFLKRKDTTAKLTSLTSCCWMIFRFFKSHGRRFRSGLLIIFNNLHQHNGFMSLNKTADTKFKFIALTFVAGE